MAMEDVSARFLSIIGDKSKEDIDFEKQRQAGLAKAGLNVEISDRSGVPSIGGISSDLIGGAIDPSAPIDFGDNRSGSEQNRETLQRVLDQRVNAFFELERQGQQNLGILQRLKGPRKWLVATSLALNPGLRGRINARLRQARKEQQNVLGGQILRLLQEERLRSVDPVELARREEISRAIGKQEGKDLVTERSIERGRDLGVLDDLDVVNLRRMGFGVDALDPADPIEQATKQLDTFSKMGTFVRLAKMDEQALGSYAEVLKGLGFNLTQPMMSVLAAEGRAGINDKPAGETAEEKDKRLNREAEVSWRMAIGLVRESGKKPVFVNREELEALDGRPVDVDDPRLVRRDVQMLEPDEILQRTSELVLENSKSIPPEFFNRFFTPADLSGVEDR